MKKVIMMLVALLTMSLSACSQGNKAKESKDMKVLNYGLEKKFYDRYNPEELIKEVGIERK